MKKKKKFVPVKMSNQEANAIKDIHINTIKIHSNEITIF